MIDIDLKYTVKETAMSPYYGSANAAGFDIALDELPEDHFLFKQDGIKWRDDGIIFQGNILNRFGPFLIPTGVSLEIPEGFEGQCRLRSSIGKLGFIMPNAPGTIDSDYRGELFVLMRNMTSKARWIGWRERIAQVVINQLPRVRLVEHAVLSETDRGSGGFGSTGK
jgi:dUTP pyrophosphatase